MFWVPALHTLAVGPDLSWRRTFERWFFETPIPTGLSVVLIGLLAGVILFKLGRSRAALLAPAAAIVLAGAIVGVGIKVQTVPELLTARTKQFVSAVVAANESDAAAILAPQVAFRTDGRLERSLDRAWVLSVVRGLKGAFESHSLEPLDAEADSADAGHTRFHSRATFPGEATQPLASTWEFTWTRSAGDQWKLSGIECLTIYGQAASAEWVAWGNRRRR